MTKKLYLLFGIITIFVSRILYADVTWHLFDIDNATDTDLHIDGYVNMKNLSHVAINAINTDITVDLLDDSNSIDGNKYLPLSIIECNANTGRTITFQITENLIFKNRPTNEFRIEKMGHSGTVQWIITPTYSVTFQ